ncbi:histone acetyltransferase type B catalytic subunit isoform X2 [Malania oleifera]|uniref:histone acetyltransferase type B catalytic subunit isoform X2 n=1 Tax=Malania oleifera TaxID=397392 RepID=UPI0025AEA6E6|nr:histone acetyltransferase type B catalytic subunit isoform X2 [Malania oleifera]
MAQKQPAADPIAEPKKRRRVGFASIVSSKEEVGTSDAFSIDPIDLNGFFDDDGKIYGYQGLKITIWVSSISFHAYADIAFQSSSDGGKGITDLKSTLEKIFAENLVDEKEDFLQTFSNESHYIKNILSSGEVLQHKVSNGHISHSNCHLGAEVSDVEVIRMVVGSMPVGHLYSRLIPLVLLLVDGSNPIDIDDSSWELYVLVQKKIDHQGDNQYLLLGFAAIYRFYHYPDTLRLRLSQILVLPPYQCKGYGRRLLEALNNVAISENVYDLTIEEPLDSLQRVRTCIDTLRLLVFNPIQHAVDSVVLHLKQGKLSKKPHPSQLDPPSSVAEDVRRSLKINKKQLFQCWEVLIYLGLEPVDKYMENYTSFISDRMKAKIIERDSGSGGKRLVEVPSNYDQETSFVMFTAQDGEAGIVQMDENQTNQEEQLQQMVDERVKEIKSIAQKVSLCRSSN